MEKEKNRWIEITVDGKITEDEITDFVSIQKKLQKISLVADSLQLWIQDMLTKEQLDEDLLNSALKK